MKKRYLPKPKPKKEAVYGVYDKEGKWWHEDDIKTFTGGLIKMFFGKRREHIKIVEL